MQTLTIDIVVPMVVMHESGQPYLEKSAVSHKERVPRHWLLPYCLGCKLLSANTSVCLPTAHPTGTNLLLMMTLFWPPCEMSWIRSLDLLGDTKDGTAVWETFKTFLEQQDLLRNTKSIWMLYELFQQIKQIYIVHEIKMNSLRSMTLTRYSHVKIIICLGFGEDGHISHATVCCVMEQLLLFYYCCFSKNHIISFKKLTQYSI